MAAADTTQDGTGEPNPASNPSPEDAAASPAADAKAAPDAPAYEPGMVVCATETCSENRKHCSYHRECNGRHVIHGFLLLKEIIDTEEIRRGAFRT